MLNLTNRESDTDKICLYAKDPYEAKHELLIKKRESTGLKHLNYSKAFIEYSNDIFVKGYDFCLLPEIWVKMLVKLSVKT